MSTKFNLANLRIDGDKEKEGVWVDAGQGLRLRIARLGNPDYTSYVNKLLRPLRDRMQGVGEPDADEIADITRQAMAKYIILDWEGMAEEKTDADGKVLVDADGEPILQDIPYSPEKALELLRDIPRFADLVSGYSRSSELFRLNRLRKTGGN